jgi:hypothetical protein
MSEPLKVRISRQGKEIGTFPADEVISLHAKGTLKDADFYWHNGMSDWAPLSQFILAETRRRQAEKEKAEEAKREERLARERANAKMEEERRAAEAARIRSDEEKSSRSSLGSQSSVGPGRTDKTDDVRGWPILGALTFIVGCFVLVVGFMGSPEGSAIRQQVLAQHMTNGILLMILGFVMARR